MMKPKRFGSLYLLLRRNSFHVNFDGEVEYRLLRNGVVVQVRHAERRFFFQFPGSDKWLSLRDLEKLLPVRGLTSMSLDFYNALQKATKESNGQGGFNGAA